MLLLLLLLLAPALLATAAPSEPKRDILSLLGADTDTDTPSPSHPTRTLLPTHKPFTRSSASPLAPTSHSSAEQRTTPWTDPAEPTAAKTTTVSTPSIPPVSAESHATGQSSKTWQIIGIAIIAVLFIATSITCAMFFDRLWRFLKDVVCCTSPPLASEEFWDTRTLSPSPSDFAHHKAEAPREDDTTRARELPWNTDTQDCNTLHRQPSRRNDLAPAT